MGRPGWKVRVKNRFQKMGHGIKNAAQKVMRWFKNGGAQKLKDGYQQAQAAAGRVAGAIGGKTGDKIREGAAKVDQYAGKIDQGARKVKDVYHAATGK